MSVQRVADLAAVSKGLIHYHFAGKDELLCACAHRLASQLAATEREALANVTAPEAIGSLWDMLVEPEYGGKRRAFLAIVSYRRPALRRALEQCESVRRAAALETVEAVARAFDLAIPVSPVAIAVSFIAFADGLAMMSGLREDPAHRQAHDAFWLAVLSMVET